MPRPVGAADVTAALDVAEAVLSWGAIVMLLATIAWCLAGAVEHLVGYGDDGRCPCGAPATEQIVTRAGEEQLCEGCAALFFPDATRLTEQQVRDAMREWDGR